MTPCIFEACRYSRLAEGQERIRVGGGRGGGVRAGQEREWGRKKIKSVRDKKEGVGERDKKEWQGG